MRARCLVAAVSVIVALVVSVPATRLAIAESPSDSLPDFWSGLIALEWETGIPDDSPLHQQADRVIMEFSKEWLMRVDFQAIERGPAIVRYRCASASVDYLETSKMDGTKGAVRSFEEWKIEAEERTLDDRQCNLVLVVDAAEKRYWVEVGGFEIPDAEKTGTITISVSGGSEVTEPIDKKKNVIQPIRFEGEFSDPWPKVLTGVFDANVQPPPGLDITYETLGGTVAWQLHRGWEPGGEIPWSEDCIGFSIACTSCVSEIDDGRCDQDDLCFCLFVSTVTGNEQSLAGGEPIGVEGCLELYCSWEPSTPEFDRAVEVVKDCVLE
jgi:hypothetical protein